MLILLASCYRHKLGLPTLYRYVSITLHPSIFDIDFFKQQVVLTLVLIYFV